MMMSDDELLIGKDRNIMTPSWDLIVAIIVSKPDMDQQISADIGPIGPALAMLKHQQLL